MTPRWWLMAVAWLGLHLAALAWPGLQFALTGELAPFLTGLSGPWVVAGLGGALALGALAALPRLPGAAAPVLGLLACVLSLMLAWSDVVRAAREARGVCAVATGIKVETRQAARGILGLTDIAHWHRLGFQWVEHRRQDGRLERRTFRHGRAVREIVAQAASEAEFRRLPEQRMGHAGILRGAEVRTLNGKVLGRAAELVMDTGWAEHLLSLGLPRAPRVCRSPLPDAPGVPSFRLPDDLIAQTLIPGS